jgi:hypothetical protein
MAKIHATRDSVRLARRCKRCGGWLVSPGSVNIMLGPVCRQRERAERDERRRSEQWALFSLAS